MRYTRMNGMKAMEMKAALTFTCLNIKKLVRMLEYRDKKTLNSSSFLSVLRQKFKNVLPYQKKAYHASCMIGFCLRSEPIRGWVIDVELLL